MSANSIKRCVLALLIGFIIGYTAGIILGYLYSLDNTSSPVEESRINVLLITRDSTKQAVQQLDSIKNAKIIEVGNLDSDSTVKLFYNLLYE